MRQNKLEKKTLKFRKAKAEDVSEIWNILKKAIQRRKEDGSNQWQDGYPNKEVIEMDIRKGAGHVLEIENNIAGYISILINDEPEYDNLKGEWLSNNDFIVFHRLAVSKDYLGKGIANELFLEVEKFAIAKNIFSIKADTNFDNEPMLYLFNKLGYTYCGEVYFRGSARRAYEKFLKDNY